MRLKNSIFLWIFPAALIPLAVLCFIATAYIENRYLAQIDDDAMANLRQIAAAVSRRFLIEREIAAGLTQVPAVERFRDDVLAPLALGESANGSRGARAALNDYVATFQSVRVSLDTVRVFDAFGQALIRVSESHAAPAVYDGLGDVAYVTEERDDIDFLASLASLPPGEAGTVLMHDREAPPQSDSRLPLYSAAIELTANGDVLGYLTIDPPIGPFNRLMTFSPRLRGAQLTVAEYDQAVAGRDGLVLFDEEAGIDLWSVRVWQRHFGELYPLVEQAYGRQSSGVVDDAESSIRTYYQEFMPYPDRLTEWLLALHVDRDALTEPFRNIRIGICVALLVTLLISAVLVGGIAKRIARPVLTLTDGLSAFAAGRRGHQVQVDGADELRAAGEAFNQMSETVKTAEQERDKAMAAQYRSRRLASLGGMAGGVAHEISNPINTILSLTTLIERQLPEDADALRKDVRSIREECERAANTIRAIMNFSHDIGGERACFDAAAWVDETVDLARRERRADGVVIDVTTNEDCVLDGDRELLLRALRNLIDNALQASPPGEVVEVRTRSDDLSCFIEVLDRGAGLGDEQLERVFDPFYSTKPPGDGAGLGLSISQGIVQHHGGEITLENRPGGGVIARIVLPLASADSQQPA